MNKYNFLVVLLISIFIFSCSKTNEITAPDNAGSQSDQQNLSDAKSPLSKGKLPEFNEKNSKVMTWDQLLPELRNATRLDNSKEPAKTGVAPTSNIAAFQFATPAYGAVVANNYFIFPAQFNS